MLFVAGQDRAYKVSWFSQTAHMVETVNAAFNRFKLIYNTMSIYGISREAFEGGRRKRQVGSTQDGQLTAAESVSEGPG